MSDIQWWGYLHVNGSAHCKRYFGPEDTAEASESPFVDIVSGLHDDKTAVLKELHDIREKRDA